MKIGMGGSQLALWQAEFTRQQLAGNGIASELVIIKTKGDAMQYLSFDKIEGNGFFTKEIEEHLLSGDVDLAVHSMKDLPTTQPDGLVVGAVSYRENPSDWLIIRKEEVDATGLLKLKKNAIVGTSSARCKAQLLDARPDVQFKDLRGNGLPRPDKLRQGQYDAIILAAAGLIRLALDTSGLEIRQLNSKEFVPAPAQGVLAFQCRSDDFETRRILKKLHHPEVSACTNIERKVLRLAGGSCHLPLGVYCEQDELGNYHVWAAMADAWDAPLRRAQLSSGTSLNLAEKVLEKLTEGR
ncbi:MAG: hydroxymethylbilane synthase [Saprospiraceae bacterium]|nr:MAG: hydroxymethylbilane synthase [Saprospiraceae bacterium]